MSFKEDFNPYRIFQLVSNTLVEGRILYEILQNTSNELIVVTLSFLQDTLPVNKVEVDRVIIEIDDVLEIYLVVFFIAYQGIDLENILEKFFSILFIVYLVKDIIIG